MSPISLLRLLNKCRLERNLRISVCQIPFLFEKLVCIEERGRLGESFLEPPSVGVLKFNVDGAS